MLLWVEFEIFHETCASVPLGIDPESIVIDTDGTVMRLGLLFHSARAVLYAGIARVRLGQPIVALEVSTYCAHGTPPGHAWKIVEAPVFEKVRTSFTLVFF